MADMFHAKYGPHPKPSLDIPDRNCRIILTLLCGTVIIGDDYPALLRGRRRTLRRSEGDRQLYRRHFWRSEGFHGETKTRHGLRRAVRRGLGNMKIQSCPTAAAINLKRLAAAFHTRFPASGLIRVREMLVSAVLA